MEQSVDLAAVTIIERDVFGEVVLSWSYPSTDENTEKVLISRSCLDTPKLNPFVFSKFQTKWQYLLSVDSKDNNATPDVDRFCVALITDKFNPESYHALLELLAGAYAKTGDALSVLELFLSAFTTGRATGKQGMGSWAASSFDPNRAMVGGAVAPGSVGGSLTALAAAVGAEQMALLWNALLLKKRVAIYGETAAEVAAVARVLPQLTWHRRDWSVLRPFVCLRGAAEEELTDLRTAAVYCAGFTDGAVRGREDLFDLLLDVSERVVVVPEAARGDFFATSLHKDVAALLGTALEAGASDQQLIKALKDKTGELLQHLRGLCGEGGGRVRLDTLTAAGMPRGVDRFLYSVALAEGVAE